MIPILFEYNTTSFTTHGIGDLVDCIACVTTQNDEGIYELSFSYPVSGELINELTIGRLIYAKANPWQDNQIFRIYGYEKEIGGKLTVKCQHISYDLANLPVRVFKSVANASANTCLANIKTNTVNISGLNISSFTFSSNVPGTAQTQQGYFEVDAPTSVRAAILDGDESVKGCFGGDLVFNNYNVSLQATGGSDRGVVIEYGVDLMDLNQEENISEMITGVYPYFTYTQDNADNTPMIAYGSIQYASGTFRTHKVAPLDLTSYFPNQAEHTAPTAAQLNAKAMEWMNAKDGFGEPEVNLTLSYATLNQDIRLYDAVTVRFVKMCIDVKAKVTSYKYDVLKEQVIEVQVGKTKKSVLFSLEDASRLRKGLLPPQRIKDKSITSEKYAESSVDSAAIKSGSVGSAKIGGGAVHDWHIGDEAVTETKIADEAVTEPKVKPLAITVSRIANGAVQTTKIQDGAVITDKLLNKAVTYAKSAYQGTLDQVDINASDIAVIKNLFIGFGSAQSFHVSGAFSCGSMTCSGYGGFSSVGASNIYCSGGNIYVNNQRVALANEIPSTSDFATKRYATTAADNAVQSHQYRCVNYSA